MTDIRGRVLEINPPGNEIAAMAYLYNFRVDGASLRSKHKLWLQENLIVHILTTSGVPVERTYPFINDPNAVYPGVQVPYQPKPQPPSVTKGNTTTVYTDPGPLDNKRLVVPEHWNIWLHGTTSRPASRKYNIKLSMRRAAAVAAFIRGTLGPTSYYSIDPNWHGEFFAELLGKNEHREDPFDRAVLVAFRPVYPDVRIQLGPPAPVNRPCCPEPCCAVKARIDYLEAVQTGWALTKTPTASGAAIDDSGDYPDVMSVPHVRPDKAHTTTALRNKGFSHKRVWELYEGNDRFMLVPLVGNPGPMVGGYAYRQLDVTTVSGYINKALEEDRKALAGCTKDDPLDICGKDYYYRKND